MRSRSAFLSEKLHKSQAATFHLLKQFELFHPSPAPGNGRESVPYVMDVS